MIDPSHLLETFGALGLFTIVFAESGLFFGFFLPGDSLLVTAGLLSSQDKLGLSFPLIALGCFVAAVAGDQVGYGFGSRVGPALFRRPDSRFFKHDHLERANVFFERYGAKTIVLARFVPIVRTFAPIVAGAGRMSYRTFVTYNVVGGLLWGVGVTTLGYTLGRTVPHVDKYLLPIIAAVVIASLIPIAIEAWRARRSPRDATGGPEDTNRAV